MNNDVKQQKYNVKNRHSGVYFILNTSTKLIKIGCSKNIENRYNDLVAQNKHLGHLEELVLLDKIICDNYYDLEQTLHTRFNEQNIINEWFEITTEDIKEVKDEMGESSYRAFDSSYVKIDKNTVPDFINMGLSYDDVGFLFHIKEYINENNLLVLDEKPINQSKLCEITKSDRKKMYKNMKIYEENYIMKTVRESGKLKYYMNPKYFRLTNCNLKKELLDLFSEDNELSKVTNF